MSADKYPNMFKRQMAAIVYFSGKLAELIGSSSARLHALFRLA